MKKYLAEFIGTAALVLVGCGAIAAGGLGGALGTAGTGPLALLPIAAAFGLTVTAMAYGIGPISGCHINPAVTVGVWAAGRMPTSEVGGYIIAQCAGAIVGAAVLAVILTQKQGGYDIAQAGLGQTGYGEFPALAAVIAEFVATFLFLVVILGVTQKNGGAPLVAGLVIGLTLLVLHLAFIKVSGNSLNPARSLGPALFVGSKALSQLWVYIVAPIAGAYVAGALFKAKTLEA